MPFTQLRNPHGLEELKQAVEKIFRENTDKEDDPEYAKVRKDGDPATVYAWTMIGIDRAHLAFVERRLRRLDEEASPGPVGKGMPGVPL